MPLPFRATVAYTQHCGNNPSQQDALWAGTQVFQQRNVPAATHDVDALSLWSAVADGLAVSPQPERASRFVLQALAAHHAAGAQCNPALVRQVQSQLSHALARGRSHGASTTLALAACSPEQCTVVHAGDSRAYRIAADGTWQQLTRDHTLLQRMIDEGELEGEEDHTSMHDSLDSCLVADSEEADFAIGCCAVPWFPGDALLLCTDGLHDTLGNRLQALHDPHLTPLGQVQAWRRAVLRCGAPDNFSLVLVCRPG